MPSRTQARGLELVQTAVDVFRQSGGRELVRRYNEFFAPDLEWSPALTGGLDGRTYRGKDGWVEYWDDFYDSFESATFGEASLEAVRTDVVLVLTVMKVRGHESGVPLETEAGFVFVLREGRVARASSHFGHETAREAALAAA